MIAGAVSSPHRRRDKWMQTKPSFIAQKWSWNWVKANHSSCTTYRKKYIDLYILAHLLEGRLRVTTDHRMVHFWRWVTLNWFSSTRISDESRYARVTMNLILQCLKPWTLKWKKFLWVVLRVLSRPGVTRYCIKLRVQWEKPAVKLFKGFLNRSLL